MSLTAYKNRMENEKPLFLCEGIADIHQLLPWTNLKLRTALDDIRERNITQVLFAGDLTNNGKRFQWIPFFHLLSDYHFHYEFALGNHDTFHRFQDSALRITPELKEHVYSQGIYHQTCYDAVSIYVLNTQKPQEDNLYFFEDQLTWLSNCLKQDHHPWKIVLCHHPFADSHPNSEDHAMHIGFQNSKLLRILNHHEDVVYLSAHLHNSYSLTSMRMFHGFACINIPPFSKSEYGVSQQQIGIELKFYQDFVSLRFRDYAAHRYIDSVSYIYDKHKKEVFQEYHK